MTYKEKMERYKRAEELFECVKDVLKESFPKLIYQMDEITIISKAKMKGLITEEEKNLLFERYR